MKKFFNEVMWYFDFYIGHLYYNERRVMRYHKYMLNRYGKRYQDRCPGCPDKL